jgi:phospholipid/cholesterol/gamma-HCH transport system substrate-binding protein
MPKKVSSLLVGLFLFGGVAILAVTLVWIGATRYFERGKLYVTYFDESVQGLQKDSEVKYRGVKVGRVTDIRIAPDNRLIAVVMNISMRDDPARTTVAQLTVTGITGVLFVNLDRRRPEDQAQAPKIEFASEYPVIISKPSEIRRIMSAIEDFAHKLKDLDVVGVAAEVKATIRDIGQLARSKEVKGILTQLERTAANLAFVTGRVEKSKSAGTLQDTLTDARATLKEARQALNALTREVEALKVGELRGQMAQITRDLRGTSQNVKQASETLEQLLERLYQRPSDVLFGKPPRKRWNE